MCTCVNACLCVCGVYTLLRRWLGLIGLHMEVNALNRVLTHRQSFRLQMPEYQEYRKKIFCTIDFVIKEMANKYKVYGV